MSDDLAVPPAESLTERPIKLHGPEGFAGMRTAGRLAAELLDFIAPFVKPGATTDELDRLCHGFTVDRDSLPKGVKETHVSLFDGTNCGIAVEGKPIFSVQYHPEASPGPHDSQYLFDDFVNMMSEFRGSNS